MAAGATLPPNLERIKVKRNLQWYVQVVPEPLDECRVGEHASVPPAVQLPNLFRLSLQEAVSDRADGWME